MGILPAKSRSAETRRAMPAALTSGNCPSYSWRPANTPEVGSMSKYASMNSSVKRSHEGGGTSVWSRLRNVAASGYGERGHEGERSSDGGKVNAHRGGGHIEKER